jgi:hypothetical protein
MNEVSTPNIRSNVALTPLLIVEGSSGSLECSWIVYMVLVYS